MRRRKPAYKPRRRPAAGRTYRKTKRYAKPKRRAAARRTGGTMQKHKAPVAVGTSMAHGKKGPAGIGYQMSQVSDNCTRITGRAYIGEVNTTGKMTDGRKNTLGLIFDINPVLLGDRVSVVASTFQKYVYHAVKFTYVPQCSTATPGSIALAFDRDPLSITANSQSSAFLAEVMSYENAVLSPAYVGCSTVYTRDPKELKTWFLGGTDGNLTTRETSQGNFMCYVSNAAADTGYGFIVMDYVLDLVAPSIMPNKQNVNELYTAPSQWLDGNGVNATDTTFKPFFNRPISNLAVGDAALAFWVPSTSWLSAYNGSANLAKPGVIGEIIINGNSGTFIGAPLTRSGSYYRTNPLAGIDNTHLRAADNTVVTLRFGQKLYFCVHARNNGATAGGNAGVCLSLHTTLASAGAAATQDCAEAVTVAGTSWVLAPDQIYASRSSGGVEETTSDSLVVSGWVRSIREGASTNIST